MTRMEALELEQSTKIYTGPDLPPRFFIELIGITSRYVPPVLLWPSALGWGALGVTSDCRGCWGMIRYHGWYP